MSSNWDYAQLAKTASEHGGPQPYLDMLKRGARVEGRTEGGIGGAAIGSLATAVVIYSVSKGHEYFKRLKKEKELAASAERKLLEGMNGTDSEDD